MLLVNLFGAPAAGKSTGAAYIFSQLKMHGVNAELVTEFAKDVVWEGRTEAFNNQVFMFGQQYFRTSRCQNKVDVIVTDSPMLLTIIYNKDKSIEKPFNDLVSHIFRSYKSLNYLLIRAYPYNPIGRVQASETEADALLPPLKQLLHDYDVEYSELKGCIENYDRIVEEVLDFLDVKNT